MLWGEVGAEGKRRVGERRVEKKGWEGGVVGREEEGEEEVGKEDNVVEARGLKKLLPASK